VGTAQGEGRVEYGELFINVGMLGGWRENAFRNSHGAWGMEEIKGNYYLMSECFMGGGKNERGGGILGK